MLRTRLKRDEVVTIAGSGRDIVGVYLENASEEVLLECSPDKADRIIKIWNKREW